MRCLSEIRIMVLVIAVSTLFILSSHINAQNNNYVGRIEGYFNQTPAGAATYTIPLKLCDGYSSFTPSISLSYNSQSGNGIAGFGWSLSGLSSISAVGHNRYFDGNEVSGVQANTYDAYAIDGKRLLLTRGINSRKGAEYATEEDNYQIIYIDSAFATTPKSFVVRQPDGTTLRYGADNNAVLRTPNRYSEKAIAWLCDHATDINGNHIKYVYSYYNNVPLLNKIEYGKNSNTGPLCTVSFVYESRPDTVSACVAGQKHTLVHRLASIECKYNNALFRKLTLTYDNNSYYSHLVSIKETGSDGRCMPMTQFVWGNIPGIQISSSGINLDLNAVISSESHMFTPCDIDNDGKIELIGMWPRQTGSQAYIMKWNGTKMQAVYSKPTLASYIYADNLVVIKHMFHSSAAAHLVPGNEQTAVLAFFTEDIDARRFAKFFFMKEGWDFSSELKHTEEMPAYVIADFDRDGKDVIKHIEKKDLKDGLIRIVTLNVNMANKYASESEQLINVKPLLSSTQQRCRIRDCLAADFDSDGLVDLLVQCDDFCIMLWNQNGLFTALNSNVLTNIKHGDTFQAADFNADGLIDLIINHSSSTTWVKAINTGSKDAALFAVSQIPELSSRQIKKQGDDDKLYACLTHDLNNDGMSDITVMCSQGNNQKAFWLKSEHDGSFSCFRQTALAPSLAVNVNNVLSCDINGDGFVELLAYGGNIYTGADTTKRWIRYSNDLSSANANKIIEVTDGIGKKTSFMYRSLLDGYTNNEQVAFPLARFCIPVHVLAESRNSWGDQSYTTTYEYEGGIYHALGKGFLGFKSMAAKSPNVKNVTTLQINPGYYTPYISSVKTTDKNDTIIRGEWFEYLFEQGAAQRSYHKNLSRKSVFDLGQKLNRIVSYGSYSYGSPQTVSQIGAISSESTCAYVNINTPDTYLLGLPATKETVYSTKNYDYENDFFYEKEINEYDTKGRLLKGCLYKGNVEDKLRLTSTNVYEYNSAGNVVKSHYLPYSSKDTLTAVSTFNQYGQLTQAVAADGHSTSFSYNSLGLVSQELDNWFGIRKTRSYDGFGRMTHQITSSTSNAFTPDTMSMSYTQGINKDYAYSVCTGSSHTTTVKEYYDAFGRRIATGTVHFDGTEYMVDTRYFSDTNFPEFVSAPHRAGTEAVVGTCYAYDCRFRPVKTTYPDGSETTATYYHNYFSSTVTEKGVSTYYEYDDDGRIVQRSDNAGEAFYYYKASGEYDKIFLEYSDGHEASAEFTYDTAGRIKGVATPNGDKQSYRYDIYGNVLSHSFGSSISGYYTTNFTYNKYGDLLKKQYNTFSGSATAAYTYNDKRLLTNVDGPNFSESRTYNAAGMLVAKGKSVSAEGRHYSKSTEYQYNGIGQVKSKSSVLAGVSYPIVETFEYTRGWMTGIKLNGRNVWHLEEEDDGGRAVRISNRLGEETSEYDSCGRLTRTCGKAFCTNKSDYETAAHTYTYDGHGRLSSKDGLQYIYDDSGLLTGWNGRSYAYDDRGNITMAGAQSQINYNGYKLKSVVSPSKEVWGKGRLSVAYNGFYKPMYVYYENHQDKELAEAFFEYDSEGNRISSVLNSYMSDELTERGDPNPEYKENEFIRAYVDDQYEVDDCEPTYTIPCHYYYVGGTPQTAPAVAAINNDKLVLWQIYRDNHGSITSMADSTQLQRYYYDPWGRYCEENGDMSDVLLHKGHTPVNYFHRGFLGQEHLFPFGLINLNARLYDPYIGRFMSFDPVFDASASVMGFNPYVYGNNCPTMHMDPKGDFPVAIVAGALIGGGINLCMNWNKVDNVWQGLGYFGVGALSGAVCTIMPCGVGVVGGISAGIQTGFISGSITGSLNALISGSNALEGLAQGALSGAVFGGVSGGVFGGVKAYGTNRNIWDGSRRFALFEDNANLPLVPEKASSSRQGSVYGIQRKADEMGLELNVVRGENNQSLLPSDWGTMTPYQKGQIGVKLTAEQLNLKGDYATEVSYRINGVTYRADLSYYDANGVLHIVESKAGPYAGFTKNQLQVFPLLKNPSNADIQWFGEKAKTLFNRPASNTTIGIQFDIYFIP